MESLGEKLKTAREERGFSHEYISRETNISSKYLDGLEKEDFSGFPGEPYVLGFLKNYGEFLGLDSAELLSLYRSLKIEEQPVPMDQLLKGPSPAPKIIRGVVVGLAVLAVAAGVYYLVSRVPKKSNVPVQPARAVSEYTMNTDFLERRFYPGDSIIITDGKKSCKMVFTSLSDAVTITTPRGPVMLDLGQDVTVDLKDSGFTELRITAADFVKNDSASGALLRFEQTALPQPVAAGSEIPQEALNAGREASAVVFSSSTPYPFTLQAVFQGYCLFRYEVLYERDKPGRNEQYYQRSEEISVTAQNGIRLGISNAQAVKLQVIGGGKTVSLDTGSAGEVVAADLRWVRDEDGRYKLALIQMD